MRDNVRRGLRASLKGALGLAGGMVSSACLAQTDTAPFVGPYVGASAGAVNHHFVLEEEDPGGATRRFNVHEWGLGGEVFAGYDRAVSSHVIVGVEAQFEFGGREAVERNPDYQFGFDPRYGYSLSARVGYVVAPRALLYAGAGYGEHWYHTIATGNNPAEFSGSLDRTRSFVLRGGAELALSGSAGLRLEFEHLDGTRNGIMLGVPIRF